MNTPARIKRHKRIRAKISGSKDIPRLVVYRSLSHNYAQIIDDNEKKVLAEASDIKEKKIAKKVDMAKKIGLKIAEKAKEKGIKSCIFDRNGYKYHGRVKAVADGAREGGLQF